MQKHSFRSGHAFIALVSALLLVGAGCISFSSSGAVGNVNTDGGIWKSANKGDVWGQKNAIATTTGEVRSISSANIVTIVQDPQDPGALYLGTAENGMWYTYDSGESWQQPQQLRGGRIPAIAVDPKNKCVVYAAVAHTLAKTVDCSRTWNVVFTDTRKDKAVTSVVVDFYDPNVVWIGNSSGDLQRSRDAGATWVPIRSFEHPIVRLGLNANDSRRLLVATKDDGVWRTADAGANWKNLKENYKDFDGGLELFDMSLGGTQDADTVVVANRYGLMRSNDFGDKWESIELLTPPRSAVIYSVYVDPRDANGLYYGTANTFYKSPNAGVNWVPKQLPTSRAATALLVDRTNQNVIYMGVTRIKQ